MKISIADKKKKLRIKQKILRKNLINRNKNNFNSKLFETLFKKINLRNIKIISSFISINSEINTKELNNLILKKNKMLCLPVIVDKKSHLTFKKFNNNNELVEGHMNIKEPPVHNKILSPDLIFIPCLAYDNKGFRLGYGGGYYDKTLNYYNKLKKNYISVGYAYDEQKVQNVPIDKFDIKLDNVITEKNIYSF